MKELNLPDLLGMADPSAHDGITDLWNRKSIHFLVVFTSPDADFEIIGVGPALPCKTLDDASAHEIPGKKPEFYVKCPAALSKRLAPKFAPAHLGAPPRAEALKPRPPAPAIKLSPAMIAPRTRAPFQPSLASAAPASAKSEEAPASVATRPRLAIKSGGTTAPAAPSAPPASAAAVSPPSPAPVKTISLKSAATMAPAKNEQEAAGAAPVPKAEWEKFLSRLSDLEARERKVFERCAAQPELFEQCAQALDRREKELAACERVAQAMAGGEA